MFDTTTCQSTSRSTVPRANEPPATPVLPVLREHRYMYCIPVALGRNVWVGANVSIQTFSPMWIGHEYWAPR